MSAPMANAAQVPIVLLAAGEGARYGGIKQLAQINGEAMLRRVARTLLSVASPVIVVTGAHAAQVETALAGLPVHIARHPRWAAGMGSSLAAGIQRVLADFPCATGALLCLADQPLLDTARLQRMLARHRAAADAILVTAHHDVDGPPVLFPRDCFASLATWSGTHGARSLIQHEARRVERFNAATVTDIDTPEDLQRVRAWLNTHRDPA